MKIINYVIKIAIHNIYFLYNMYLIVKNPKLKQINQKDKTNIILDPLQPYIIIAFKMINNKKNKIDTYNNNLNFLNRFQCLFKKNVGFARIQKIIFRSN